MGLLLFLFLVNSEAELCIIRRILLDGRGDEREGGSLLYTKYIFSRGRGGGIAIAFNWMVGSTRVGSRYLYR